MGRQRRFPSLPLEGFVAVAAARDLLDVAFWERKSTGGRGSTSSRPHVVSLARTGLSRFPLLLFAGTLALRYHSQHPGYTAELWVRRQRTTRLGRFLSLGFRHLSTLVHGSVLNSHRGSFWEPRLRRFPPGPCHSELAVAPLDPQAVARAFVSSANSLRSAPVKTFLAPILSLTYFLCRVVIGASSGDRTGSGAGG